MTDAATDRIIRLMRGTWPTMYLTDDGEVAWKFWLEDKDSDEVLHCLRLIADRQEDPPSVPTFNKTLRELHARKHACPCCGHGVATEGALAEHMFNVHGVE
ncbi:MAG: hypothetical protein OEV86_15085 [Candidatus Krumholzibacteria bacterium]|nr:hypothetical protein [Candidatus Krumholzibacteria bacterium]